MQKRKPIWYFKHHYNMWMWLSENPKAIKVDWPGWRRFKSIPRSNSFLCAYTLRFPIGYQCLNCPLQSCVDANTLHNRWLYSSSEAMRVKYAKQIAEAVLPYIEVEEKNFFEHFELLKNTVDNIEQ